MQKFILTPEGIERRLLHKFTGAVLYGEKYQDEVGYFVLELYTKDGEKVPGRSFSLDGEEPSIKEIK